MTNSWRILLLLGLIALPAPAAEFGRTLRALKADDRVKRREALRALAKGTVRHGSSSEAKKGVTALQRFLSDRFPGFERALAVRALGRLKEERVYGLFLKRLEKERDDRVLEAMEEVFRLGPLDLAEDLAVRIHKTDSPTHRAVLLRMLGALPGPEARRRIRLRARMGDHWCPRAAAVHALARDRGEEALTSAMELVDASDPALVTAAIQSLGKLSGKGFGRDVLAWKTWWNTRAEVAPMEEALDEAGKSDRRTYAHEVERKTIAARFFSIPIKGPKVVFVFDVSASMRYKLPIAYEQLIRAIKSLPSTAQFEVVFFNEHVWPWRGRLSHADPVTKELLVQHLATIEIKSYTNLFDALERGLAMEPDELFVISDGAPNRGRKKFPRDILSELKELNTHGTRINSVSVVRVVDGEEHIALLKAIAEAHKGEHVQRTLK